MLSVNKFIISLCLSQCLRFPHIEPVLTIYGISLYMRLRTDIHVKRDYGEFAGPTFVLHILEDGGGKDMDTTESLQLIMITGIIKFLGKHFAGGKIGPATETIVFIHQQVTGCFPAIGKQGGVCLALYMVTVEGIKVYIRQDVGIVYQERLIALQQGGGLF